MDLALLYYAQKNTRTEVGRGLVSNFGLLHGCGFVFLSNHLRFLMQFFGMHCHNFTEVNPVTSNSVEEIKQREDKKEFVA